MRSSAQRNLRQKFASGLELRIKYLFQNMAKFCLNMRAPQKSSNKKKFLPSLEGRLPTLNT